MDGFGTNSGVIILAATNRVDILDKALLRAGRFDRQIHVDLPDLQERVAIFKVHLRPLKLDDTVDVDLLARQTPGFSGADIANVCNEAALIAARHNRPAVGKQDFLDAVDRIIGGLEKKTRVMTAEEKRTIALHEAGHATVSWFLKYANPLVKVTIVPRGQALGAAWYLPEERNITTKEQMLDEICATLGGRAAEELFTGHISSGALNDLETVTKRSYGMVAYLGMSDKLPNLCYYNNQEYNFTKPYSEKTAEAIDTEVSQLIAQQYIRAKELLSKHKEGHAQLAQLLIDREVIFAEDVEKIFGKRPWKSRADELLEEENKKSRNTLPDSDASTSTTLDVPAVTEQTETEAVPSQPAPTTSATPDTAAAATSRKQRHRGPTSLPKARHGETSMSNLVQRSLTGILFVLLIVGGIVLSPMTFALVFAVVTGLSVWEFSTLMNRHGGAQVNRFINTVAAVYLFFSFFGYCTQTTGPEAFIPYLLSIIYLLVSELYRQAPNPLRNWAYAFASQVYVALPFALLNVLAFQPDPAYSLSSYVWAYPLSIFVFLWTNDTGAYVCGSLLHRYVPYKLFPRVSPGKSWIGSIGGAVFCVVAALILSHFFPELTTGAWVGLSLVACIFGTWGDLVESLLKRQLGLKDSGHILPGHGGMLDRFDSTLLAVPAAVLYFYTLSFL